MLRRFCYLLLFFLTGTNAFSQFTNFHPEIINEASGLPDKEVACMVQDSSGYMWMGSRNGLCRYDGYSFKLYKNVPQDSSSLLYNGVNSIVEDKNHLLWIGYTKGNLSCFNPATQKFIHYIHNPAVPGSIPPGMITFMYVDRENTLWLGTIDNGLIRFDRENKSFFRYGTLPDIDPRYTPESKKRYNCVNSMYERLNGDYYVITSNGLYLFDKKKSTLTPKRNKPVQAYRWRDDAFGPYTVYGDTALWLGSWGGGLEYYNMNTGTWKIYKFDLQYPESGTHNVVHDLSARNDSEIWIVCSEKIGIFNIPQEQFSFHEGTPGVNGDPSYYNRIYIDHDRNVWITHEKGISLLKANSSLFSFINLPVKQSTNGIHYNVNYIYKDTANHLLFLGTAWADGLHVVNEKTKTEKCLSFLQKPHEEPALIVTDIEKDSKGRIWVVTRDYIYQYNVKEEKLVLVPQPSVDTSFHRSPYFVKLKEDDHHRFWIASLRYGIYKFDPETFSYSHFDHKDGDTGGIASRGVITIASDRLHRTWFATDLKGLCLYDEGTGRFIRYAHHDGDPNSLADSVISNMVTDHENNIWIGTYGGISKMDVSNSGAVSFINYTTAKGLPSDIIYDIQCENNDNVWLSTGNGISTLNPATGRVKNYTVTDGLSDNIGQEDFFKSDDGEFFISEYKGYYRFFPQQINGSKSSSPLVINSFKIFDKEAGLPLHSTIQLSYAENFFSFDFAAINYTSPEKIQYAYMLQGFDKDWIYCGKRRYASYTNLNGGDYIFNVKALDAEGNWGKAIAVPIHIEPPYWKKLWFILLLTLALSLMIYAVYWYRVRQITRTEHMKTDFNKKIAEVEMRALRAQMNPHFIFNCLNSINRYIVKSDTKTASLYLTKFSRLIRLILDNSESKNVPLANELEALRLYIEMETIRFENKFTYIITTEGEVDSDTVEVPPLIIQPYVENAIWHGLLNKETAGKLSIHLTRMNGMLECIVEDNGVGRTKAKEFKSKSATKKKSLGMKLTEERLAMLNEHGQKASVDIIDLKDPVGEDCGTRVIIKIPVFEN